MSPDNLTLPSSQFLNIFKTIPAHPQSKMISVEGIEGAGKSTQLNFLQRYFTALQYDVMVLREPGGTLFGEKLREAILNYHQSSPSQEPLHPLAEAYLFASSRAQLLHEKILPQLQKPRTIILLDRYIDSSLVYQGVTRGLGIETILQLHSFSPLYYLPHLTFYFKISLEVSQQRMKSRGREKDYFESSQLSFFQQLIQGYDQVQTLFPQRIKMIDAEKDEGTVSQQLEKLLKSAL